MGGWESKPRHQQPPPMQILVYKGHWCKIVFRQLWFGAWRLSELGTIQRRYWHLPLYSDVQGEVLFGQFLVLIWPWLHINSDKHHFLCSHFIGLFLISIFPGCFLWGWPRRSLWTWTSGWRRRWATKRSSKATRLATLLQPTSCPSWCEKILWDTCICLVWCFNNWLSLKFSSWILLWMKTCLTLSSVLNVQKHVKFFTLLIFVKSTLSNT